MQRALKKIADGVGLRCRHAGAARMSCERHLLATGSRRRTRSTGRIRGYHSVSQTVAAPNEVTPDQFGRYIELALRQGFRFVPASPIARSGGGPTDLAMAFDDGWSSALTEVAPILRDPSIPWTLFVVSGWSDHVSDWAKGTILTWHDIGSEARGA